MSDEVNASQHHSLIHTQIEDILHHSYLQYSLSVNVGRAIPDVRDGLKPVNRRILYDMHVQKLTKSHSYVKSARVVGDVIAKYHPHGDSAVYDTMVRMAQDFSLRCPLIDGQGNWGSIDGDAPAAYRYTECRMEKLAEELLADLDKDTVDMAPNFDEKEEEPTVLPARFPNLLVNGTTGIGVGMATSIPPHNLGETIDACVALLDNPAAAVADLMKVLPAPDFPTGGTIIGTASIRKLYETGRGSVALRGKARIEETKDGREQIIVTEIPYMVNKENLVKKIAELVNDKVLTGISSLNDESSSRAGIRIVIGVKRDAMGTVVLNQLFKHTNLQTSYGCQFLVVDKKRPRTLNLKQMIQAYLDHRLEVITRRIRFELDKAEKRAHIVEGLLIAVNAIDDVIEIIRKSANREDAHEKLTARFGLTKVQTSAILDMRLAALTGLAVDELKAEWDSLSKAIAGYKELLGSRNLRLGIVRTELVEVRDKYADKRRSDIIVSGKDINIEDLIKRETVAITVSEKGYIKRMPLSTFRTMNRGAQGKTGVKSKEDDSLRSVFTACTHDYVLFLTNQGRMLWLKGYDIPEASATSVGKNAVNLLEFGEGESIRAWVSSDKIDDASRFIVMLTKNGVIKKTCLQEFKNLRKKAIKAINLDDDDDLLQAEISDGSSDILISTKNGRTVRFSETGLRELGRASRGVKAVTLKDGDSIVSMSVVAALPEAAEEPEADEAEGAENEAEGEETFVINETQLLVITSKGLGKRSAISGYRKTSRGTQGVNSIRLKDGDSVVASLKVTQDDEVLLTSAGGIMSRVKVAQIPAKKGRLTQGVKVMTLKNSKDYVLSVTLINKVDGEDIEEVPAESAETAAPAAETPKPEGQE
ncbi:MAG: hypothetical protein RL095_2634 [Verrucomicrobiota bacterium]|jgi:DNA gyrase subunit A